MKAKKIFQRNERKSLMLLLLVELPTSFSFWLFAEAKKFFLCHFKERVSVSCLCIADE